jgi:long-subunit acyl-CoA synthetase (AMP-forming)
VSIMADKLVTVAEYMDSMQAEMARQILEDFDIKAVIIGENAANTCLAPTVMTAKLQVLEKDADEAKQILEDQEQGHEPEEYEVMDETDEADEPYDPKQEEL